MRHKRRIYSTLIFLIISTISWLPSNAFAAAGRDVSNNVTSLKVSPTDVGSGERLTVDFTFDERRINIQSGDFINITWPENENVIGRGFQKTIDLYIQNKNVGSLTITLDQAQVLFNDNINNLDDVQGSGHFEIQAQNISTNTAGDTGILNIISGEKTASVSVTKYPDGGDRPDFYFKVGDMQPEDTQRVRWFLSSNNNESDVEAPITIMDEIQEGQRLDASSFQVYVKSQGIEKYYFGEEGITEFLATYPGTTMTYSEQTNSISIFIPTEVAKYRMIRFFYFTTIENDQQEKFENHSTVSYHEANQPAVKEKDFNYSVDNINASGNVSGTIKGELKIVKRLQGTEIGIPNVQFELKRTDGQTIQGQTAVTLTSDSQGIADIKGLQVGDYEVREIAAPDWIVFDSVTSNTLKFTIGENDTSGIELSIYNQKATTNVTATKLWTGGGASHPTTYFKLYRQIENGEKEPVPSATIKELANGVTNVTWTGLDQYDNYGKKYAFSVQEVDQKGNGATPLGYSKQENGLTVTNTNIETTRIEGRAIWIDNNDNTQKRPTNIRINLLANGKLIKSLETTSTNDWKYSFTNLPKYQNGEVIVYTIAQDSVSGYDSKVDGYNILNTYHSKVINFGNSNQINNSQDYKNEYNPQHINNMHGSKESVEMYSDPKSPNDNSVYLPETNDKEDSSLSILGVCLGIMLSGVLLLRRNSR